MSVCIKARATHRQFPPANRTPGPIAAIKKEPGHSLLLSFFLGHFPGFTVRDIERGVKPGKFEIFLEASRAFATAGAQELNFPDPVLGVNHLAAYGRWTFAEFTEIYQMEADFKAKVENEFKKLIEKTTKP